MERNIFSPKVQGMTADMLSSFFLKGARIVFGLTLALLPVWFIPFSGVSLGFTKATFVVVGSYLAIVLAALALLRSGKVQLHTPLLLVLFWLFTGVSLAASLLSGDSYDSLFGGALDVHTSGFIALMATVMTLCLMFVGARAAIVRLLLSLCAALGLVYLFSLVRIFFGPEILSLGVFTSSLSTMVGSFNDLALYAGLCIVMLLIGLQALPKNRIAQGLAFALVVSSLIILAVVNFAFVWYVIGLLSLLSFLYFVAKDTWLNPTGAQSEPVSRFTLTLVALVCVVSGAFIVSGDQLGSRVSALTGISYLEVRPSFDATVDIAKAVYQENAFTGIGPNRFEDAWRLYKSQIINETQFWNTSFTSGNSYAFTLLITTGFVGSIVFLAFIGQFLFVGYRLLLTESGTDDGWNLVGLMSFSAALYLWVMAFCYTPGTTVLLLTALFTGLTVAVYQSRLSAPVRVINVAYSRQHGFLLIASSVFLIIGTTALLIFVTKQYTAQLTLAESLESFAQTGEIPAYDRALEAAALAMPEQDVYVAERARLRLAELNRLLGLAAPSTDDQRLFELALLEGVQLTEAAISLDRTNPFNYALLGSFYGALNPQQFEGVGEKRNEAFAQALRYDPNNPEYSLLEAQIAARNGEPAVAREKSEAALRLKSNYTDALFLLSQLDIAEGNATSAIATTRSIISLEPGNPGRSFQLGLLLLATGDLDGAVTAFENAVMLDQNYANARYMLALAYVDQGRVDEALVQLKIVETTNSDNESLKALIAQIESGDLTRPALDSTTVPVVEEGVTSDEQAVTTEGAPDTDLVSPVNRVPEADVQEVQIATSTTAE
jgi:tetratricopeptide (TPR) repeat protein